MASDPAPLIDRVRTMLASEPSTREVAMFGGLSFMVQEKMVVATSSGGGLLVRVDPERDEELVALPGVSPAEMGAGRIMGPGWIHVEEEAVATDEQLQRWIDVALEYNALTPPRGRPARPR